MEMRNGMHEKRFVSFVSQDDEKFRAEEKNIADQTKRGKGDMSFGAQDLSFHRSTENSVRRMQDRVASGDLEPEVAEEMIRKDRERTGESLHRDFEVLFARRERFPFLKADISLMLRACSTSLQHDFKKRKRHHLLTRAQFSLAVFP